jgi:ribosomal small subunit protein bTHX
MGKGDKKTKRGKIIIGSYGVRRPRQKKKTNPPVKSAPAKTEVIKAPVREVPFVEEPVKTILEPVIQVAEKKTVAKPKKTEKAAGKETVKKEVKAKAPAKKASKATKPAEDVTPPSEPVKE